MKKLQCITSLCILVLASAATAQEFKLPIRMTGQLGYDKTIAIGYDPSAIDSSDQQDVTRFGEDLDYPGGIGFGTDIFLRRPDLTSTRMDIRKKPDSATFSLTYRLYLSASGERLPITLSWDPQKIPATIQSITIAPIQSSSHIYSDLKQHSSITIGADSISPYSQLFVTINYNPFASVESSSRPQSLTASNNPVKSRTALSFDASSSGNARIMACDQAGRLIYSREIRVQPGKNRLVIDRKEFEVSSGLVFLRMMGESGISQTLQLVVE
jgi:hypothetical protein